LSPPATGDDPSSTAFRTVSDSVVPEAGAIAARLLDNVPRVLLVHARSAQGEWILPKGHLEPGETAAGAARRELAEEAGVDGDVVQLVGTLEFVAGTRRVRVEYFLVHARATPVGPGEPNRNPTWFSFDEAMKVIVYEETRALLAKAREIYVRSLA
jgi:8-oxo-dGTP pyrophosphatase MutT (NUDIX family)